MSRERLLRRRLRSLSTLGEAIGALRSLSAQHFRAARNRLPEVRAYRDEVARLLPILEPTGGDTHEGGPPGIVLVTSDLGLVGDYTARLVEAALVLRSEIGTGPLVCVGRRALGPLARAGVTPIAVQPGPTSVEALLPLLLPLVDTMLSLRRTGKLGAVWLVAARFEGAGHYEPTRVPVLPVGPPDGAPPLAVSPYSGLETTRSVVVREYLYAALYETLLEALASEHGKRLVTAESAHSWLEEKTGSTQRRLAAIRRESSTQEVLEIATAARATRRPTGGVR